MSGGYFNSKRFKSIYILCSSEILLLEIYPKAKLHKVLATATFKKLRQTLTADNKKLVL